MSTTKSKPKPARRAAMPRLKSWPYTTLIHGKLGEMLHLELLLLRCGPAVVLSYLKRYPGLLAALPAGPQATALRKALTCARTRQPGSTPGATRTTKKNGCRRGCSKGKTTLAGFPKEYEQWYWCNWPNLQAGAKPSRIVSMPRGKRCRRTA